jgi:hypothetical protein
MALTVALLQAGARPVSQPPTPAGIATVGDDGTLRLKGSELQESRVSIPDKPQQYFAGSKSGPGPAVTKHTMGNEKWLTKMMRANCGKCGIQIHWGPMKANRLLSRLANK